MNRFDWFEVARLVEVENVGEMLRVELTAHDGEVLSVHYRWPVGVEAPLAEPTLA